LILCRYLLKDDAAQDENEWRYIFDFHNRRLRTRNFTSKTQKCIYSYHRRYRCHDKFLCGFIKPKQTALTMN
jgi:hypothetical protein